MEALERINALVDGRQSDVWAIKQLAALGHEAVRRWEAVQETLQVNEPFGSDAVALIEPEIQLRSELLERIQQKLGMSGRYANRFLKWQLCSKTCMVANPFEPLVEIMEHGGSCRVEHAMFLDIYSADGQTCGICLIKAKDSV
jgi:hypothetical protein